MFDGRLERPLEKVGDSERSQGDEGVDVADKAGVPGPPPPVESLKDVIYPHRSYRKLERPSTLRAWLEFLSLFLPHLALVYLAAPMATWQEAKVCAPHSPIQLVWKS